jgi:long-chain fatty acid transport protein
VVGSSSGDMAPAYSFSSLAYRTDITNALSFALILDEPIGADVDYTGLGATPGYLYRTGFGSQAELRSHQVTLAARYEMPNGFSVYGGARIVGFEGQVDLFNGTGGGAARYTLDAEASTEIGYMLGAAYERPDIAMRVALTYYSETNHDITASETTGLGTTPTTFQTAVPQQLLLEGQTGVAEGTLVFGSIRWTDWTEFTLSPPVYVAGVSSGRALVEYEKDVFTYVIGGARVLNDQWTAARLAHLRGRAGCVLRQSRPHGWAHVDRHRRALYARQHADHGRHQLHLDRRGRDPGARTGGCRHAILQLHRQQRHRRGP